MMLILIMLGLAVASRANALILLPIVGLAVLYKLYRRELKWDLLENPYVRIGLLLACLGFAMGPGRTEFYRIVEDRHEPFLVANIHSLARVLTLEPWSFNKLLLPHPEVYFKHPVWNVFTDENGRQYFWSSMLKSSLFGEYNWPNKPLATVDILLLSLILYVMDGCILHRRFLRSQPQWWMCMVTLFIPIAALMENRIINPFACSEDFRYIYPAIVSFCGLFGLVIQRHIDDWRPFRKVLGALLCLAFCVSAVEFYIL